MYGIVLYDDGICCVLYEISCFMFRYTYEFEWNKACVYRYDWFAYEDLNGFLLRCTYMIVLPKSCRVLVYSDRGRGAGRGHALPPQFLKKKKKSIRNASCRSNAPRHALECASGSPHSSHFQSICIKSTMIVLGEEEKGRAVVTHLFWPPCLPF
jgi:hypothetical protein